MPADFLHARRTYLVVIAALLVAMTSGARDKSKDNVPAYVLEAHTVSVLIDPQAGMGVRDPQENRTAESDVQTALLNWGRFQTTLNSREADLLVVVRKGNGRIANATIADPSQNRRPGAIDPTDSGVLSVRSEAARMAIHPIRRTHRIRVQARLRSEEVRKWKSAKRRIHSLSIAATWTIRWMPLLPGASSSMILCAVLAFLQ